MGGPNIISSKSIKSYCNMLLPKTIIIFIFQSLNPRYLESITKTIHNLSLNLVILGITISGKCTVIRVIRRHAILGKCTLILVIHGNTVLEKCSLNLVIHGNAVLGKCSLNLVIHGNVVLGNVR